MITSFFQIITDGGSSCLFLSSVKSVYSFNFQPKKDKNVLDNLLDVVTRLKQIEAQMQKMRKECQEREKIWEAVEREVNFLEEKAVIYRYKVMDTQSVQD
ncbi:hypothetical protein NECAME_00832 [Necator americanus]|uniref:Uncharacterized protein n=1 Tax=Necator americanus TaxID=51031 RepID=W2SN78_NECAM|nr:hypothetical protein NECAME_00832 [Necator americanus]ETN71144.1 hypothetical protein NECAME_00832 [Necator americanus]